MVGAFVTQTLNSNPSRIIQILLISAGFVMRGFAALSCIALDRFQVRRFEDQVEALGLKVVSGFSHKEQQASRAPLANSDPLRTSKPDLASTFRSLKRQRLLHNQQNYVSRVVCPKALIPTIQVSICLSRLSRAQVSMQTFRQT